jgi:uncharacterized membrane protein YphA (DoxX/SURF4 family)
MSLENKYNGFSIRRLLFRETSGIPLALFRICFGLVMFYESGRLIWTPLGSVRYFDPVFHFKYPFFEWVIVGPDWFMNLIMWLCLMVAVLFTIGLAYRLSAILMFLCFSYLTLIDITYWNNHYYLYGLFSAFFVFTDAGNRFSIDSLIRQRDKRIPNWQTLLFKAQLALVYFYGGLSKLLNPDWLNQSSVYAIMESAMLRNELVVSDQTMSILVAIQTYGGIGFDLVIGFLLFYERAFVLALVSSVIFHLTNHYFLNIGTFPFAMLGSLFLFVPLSWLKEPNQWKLVADAQPLKRNWTTVLIIGFWLFQGLFPLRHLVYEGSVFWTAEGKLGAWHMMSGNTEVFAEYFYLYETDSITGDTLAIEPIKSERFLTKKQQRTLGQWPFLLPSFANFLKQEAELVGFQNVSICADIFVSRNGRRPKPIVAPDIDLCSVRRKTFGHNDWVLLYAEEHY